jgi:hypothetical protein
VAMNSEPDAELDGEPDPADTEVSELDTGPLQDSRDAIDRGREAAREALKDDADRNSAGRNSDAPEEPKD